MVMGDITRIDTVQQYCDLFEVEALHPLVSVVNCYEVQAHQTLKETVQHLCCVAERY